MTKKNLWLRIASMGAPLLSPAAALAHPGHGLSAPFHWHATDTLGLLLVGGLGALAIWLARGGK